MSGAKRPDANHWIITDDLQGGPLPDATITAGQQQHGRQQQKPTWAAIARFLAAKQWAITFVLYRRI